MNATIHRTISYRVTQHFSVPSPWSLISILAVLGLLVSSTAFSKHLDIQNTGDSHNSYDGIALDPTLKKFLTPPTPSPPSPQPEPHTRNEPIQNDVISTIPDHSPENLSDHDSHVPHAKLGWKLLLNGQPDAAMFAYRQALRKNPSSANAFLGLGMTYKAIGKLEEAREAIASALELNPQLAPALVHLGYLYIEEPLDQPNIETARRLFRQASQIGDPFARIALLDLQTRASL